jgi:hypothetical protein
MYLGASTPRHMHYQARRSAAASPLRAVPTDTVGPMGREAVALFNRIFGVKPARDAPLLARLIWFRGYYLRMLPLTVLALVACGFVLSGSLRLIAAVLALPWLLGFARLNMEIRQARRRP